MRKCKVCGKIKKLSNFYIVTSKGKQYHRYECINCFNSICNRNGRDKKRERIRENREYAIKKLGGKCLKCGCDIHSVLHFHHIIPRNGSYGAINRLQQFTGSNARKKLDKELEKCILLCQNCHIITHSEH